eukprot:m.236092 g.236092  ORF g.236092 m.236092 type:complete len:302 (-) comp20422_c0_seq1:77-982(-)
MAAALLASTSDSKWVQFYKNELAADPSMSTAVGAIRTLMAFIQQSDASTLFELRSTLKNVVDQLVQSTNTKYTSVESACELFMRFITLKGEESFDQDFNQYKKLLYESGNVFLGKAMVARDRIAPKAEQFIRDGATILTHARSRSVAAVLLAAAKKNRLFSVYVTESPPLGLKMMELLTDAGIPVTLIPDAAVGYIIERVDFVIVGAEAVVESGGIVNSIGTYQMSMAAKIHNKPFYAVAESLKFVRMFPLRQGDIPCETGGKELRPILDYTPPSFISLLFTDLGVLTPSAISDELIKLYC